MPILTSYMCWYRSLLIKHIQTPCCHTVPCHQVSQFYFSQPQQQWLNAGHLFTIRLNPHITLCDDNWMDDLAQHHNDGAQCSQKVTDDTTSLMSSNEQTGIMMTLWKCSPVQEWTDTMSWHHIWWWRWTQTKSTDIDDYGSRIKTLAGTAPRPKLLRQHSYFVCPRLLWVQKQQCISATFH